MKPRKGEGELSNLLQIRYAFFVVLLYFDLACIRCVISSHRLNMTHMIWEKARLHVMGAMSIKGTQST